jgi:hypothetical protein
MPLALASTKCYFGFGDKDDHVVLDGGRVIGRIFPIAAIAARSQPDVDDHRNGVPADDPKPRLFTDTRASDGGFQGAVAKLAAFFRQKLREKPVDNQVT